MRAKEEFLEACREIELELAYRLGVSEEELDLLEEYYRVKILTQESGGIAYRHALRKIEKLKERVCLL